MQEQINLTLWFDVGFKRYTTHLNKCTNLILLWFDVGFKRYTTQGERGARFAGCGLM